MKISRKKTGIALFDFDGTVTTRDSFVDFMKYSKGIRVFLLGFITLSPFAILYFLGMMPSQRMKEFALTYFYKAMPVAIFNDWGRRYQENGVAKIIRVEALRKIDWHKKKGHDVVIVSASLEAWLLPWCQKNGIELIATKIEEKNEKLTGKIFGKNCEGEEKVVRIKDKYELDEYERVYAYGNSKYDFPMLMLADERYMRWKLMR